VDVKMKNDINENIFIAGPLNLYRDSKNADTVLGLELSLSEEEFDALDLLAVNEGEVVTDEQLCEAIWKGGDETGGEELVKTTLNRLMELINIAGTGFMWIEHIPSEGYVFRTRWGSDWHSELEQERRPLRPEVFTAKRKKFAFREHRVINAILTSIGSMVLAVLLISVVMLFGSNDDTVIFDGPVPLGVPDFINGVEFGGIGGAEYFSDQVTSLELYNPVRSNLWLVFELALADTGESFFKSEPIAPGSAIAVVSLPEGENEVILTISSYDSGTDTYELYNEFHFRLNVG